MQATDFVVVVGGEEPRSGEGVPRSLGLGNQVDPFAVERRFLAVTFLVMRSKVVGSELAGGFQGGIEHATVMLGITRTLQQRFGVEHFIELEAEITVVEQGVGHAGSRRRAWGSLNRPGAGRSMF
ncbi:hypothetical protein D9M68_578750 [compost metagenome]